MIHCTVTKKLIQGSFRTTRIRVEGHAEGEEARRYQVCAATSMWMRGFADHCGKVHWLEHGKTDLRISKEVSPEIVRYMVRGLEILAHEVASDNVHLRTEWVLPCGDRSRGSKMAVRP